MSRVEFREGKPTRVLNELVKTVRRERKWKMSIHRIIAFRAVENGKVAIFRRETKAAETISRRRRRGRLAAGWKSPRGRGRARDHSRVGCRNGKNFTNVEM